MEKKGFFQLIHEKKQLQLKKLSLDNKSSNVNQKIDNSTGQIQSPTFSTQLPSFINRKIKNLKPYTNHYKKYNLVNNKISDNTNKNSNLNLHKYSPNINNILEKKNIARNQNNNQIIILPDNRFQFANKISQISVYQQFLQKTNSTFSSFFEQFKQTTKNVKNKINYNTYDHRKNKNQQQKNLLGNRISLGNKQIQNQKNLFQTINQRIIARSANSLPKNQQDKQLTILVQNQNKKFKSIYQQGKIEQITSSIDFQSLNIKNQIKILTPGVAIFPMQKQSAKPNKYYNTCDVKINQIKMQSLKNQSSTLQPTFSSKNNQIKYKFSPQKNNQKLLKNIKKYPQFKDIKKNLSEPPLSVKNRAACKDKSNNKIQIEAQTQLSLPSNITAYSYIIYEPSFSQNPKLKIYDDNLRNTNKVFNNCKIIASLNCKTVVEIASLTKIMTFILALQISQKFSIKQQQQKVKIGKFQSNINGTSAQIKQGEIYTLEQLFYGLMLPSGNDASLAIAIWGGKKLLISQIKQKLNNKKKPNQLLSTKQSEGDLFNSINSKDKKIVLKKKRCYQRFILQMNKKARNLAMTKTNYANSHGLANNLNKSCAYDLALLCQYVMKNEKFKKVVSTINYSGTIQVELIVQNNQFNNDKNINKSQKEISFSDQNKQKLQIQNQKFRNDYQEHQNQHSDQESSEELEQKDDNKDIQIKTQKILVKRQINWQNTHKLLSKEQYIGIKTGITNTAGPCLASCIKTSGNRFFIIIVLNSKKINYRFKDTQTLKKWIFKKFKINKNQSAKNNKIQNLQIPLTSQLKFEMNENQI